MSSERASNRASFLPPPSLPSVWPPKSAAVSTGPPAPSSWVGCCCPLPPPSLLPLRHLPSGSVSVPSLPFPLPEAEAERERGMPTNQPSNQPSHFPHNRASGEGRAAGGELLSYSLGVGSGAFAGGEGKGEREEGGGSYNRLRCGGEKTPPCTRCHPIPSSTQGGESRHRAHDRLQGGCQQVYRFY